MQFRVQRSVYYLNLITVALTLENESVWHRKKEAFQKHFNDPVLPDTTCTTWFMAPKIFLVHNRLSVELGIFNKHMSTSLSQSTLAILCQ